MKPFSGRSMTSFFVLLLSALVVLGGCESSPQDKMREARGAILSGNADLAEERLQEVMAAGTEPFETRRLMASVHVLRGEFEKAEEALRRLWTEQGLDGEGLDETQRRQRSLLRDQFNELYRRWVDSLDPGADPELFEEVVLKGLDRDRSNARFNAMLVDFYNERADRFVERNEKVRAAEELEKIDGLRAFRDVRRGARERAANLRHEAFGAQARARFVEEVQPGLMESESFDAGKETVRLQVNQSVDRRLDPESDEARIQARTIATRSIAPTIAQLAISLTEIPFEEVDLSKLNMPEMSVEGENFRRGSYEMVVVIKLENLIRMAFDYAEHARTRPEESPEEVAQGEGDAEAQESEEKAGEE